MNRLLIHLGTKRSNQTRREAAAFYAYILFSSTDHFQTVSCVLVFVPYVLWLLHRSTTIHRPFRQVKNFDLDERRIFSCPPKAEPNR